LDVALNDWMEYTWPLHIWLWNLYISVLLTNAWIRTPWKKNPYQIMFKSNTYKTYVYQKLEFYEKLTCSSSSTISSEKGIFCLVKSCTHHNRKTPTTTFHDSSVELTSSKTLIVWSNFNIDIMYREKSFT